MFITLKNFFLLVCLLFYFCRCLSFCSNVPILYIFTSYLLWVIKVSPFFSFLPLLGRGRFSETDNVDKFVLGTPPGILVGGSKTKSLELNQSTQEDSGKSGKPYQRKVPKLTQKYCFFSRIEVFCNG